MFINHKSKEQIESEADLISAAQKDLRKFELIYNAYFERVFRFIYQRLDSKEVASDISSQVFLKAMENIKKYNNYGIPFSAWLFRIAINEMNNYFTKQTKERTINIDTIQIEGILFESGIEFENEKIELLVNSLKQLTEGDLLLIELRFFENNSFKEIGEILDITENNAKVKTYRILDRIKQMIVKHS